MLSRILSYYNQILNNTGFFEVNFDLAEVVCDNEKTFYAIYGSDGGYAFDNQNISNYNGLSYWFVRGNVVNDLEKDPNKAGKWRNRINYPLSLIFVIPRDIVSQDCSTTSLDTLQTVASQFTRQTKELRQLLSATEVTYGRQSWITDRKQILSNQYSNTGPIDADYKYHYFQLNIDLTVVIPSECLDDICEIESSDIINLFDWCNPSTYFRLTIENEQCIQDNLCSGATPSGIAYFDPPYGGATTQYAVNDSKWQLDNGAYDVSNPVYPASYAYLDYSSADPIRTLINNNAFGNKFRFTDDLGTQVYASGYIIDHHTNRGWKSTKETSATWDSALSGTASKVFATFSDWRLPLNSEYYSIVDNDNTSSAWGYAPFSNTDGAIPYWTLETSPPSTSSALVVYPNIRSLTGNNLIYNTNRLAKSSSATYYIVRTHYT